MNRLHFVFVCLFVISNKSFAVEKFMTLGFGPGGEKLESLTGLHSHGIQAGDGFLLSTGLIFAISDTKPHAFETQIGIGYLFFTDSDDEERNKVTWSRWPIDLIYYYRNHRNEFRLGYGVTYHFQNKLKGKELNANVSSPVDDALGWLVSIEKYFDAGDGAVGAWGLRYTSINYQFERFTKSLRGDSIMLTLTISSGKSLVKTQEAPTKDVVLNSTI
ncbi:hypothetical protein K2X05_13365 [bacterium]|nr:hypothetical protein [bacterium]